MKTLIESIRAFIEMTDPLLLVVSAAIGAVIGALISVYYLSL